MSFAVVQAASQTALVVSFASMSYFILRKVAMSKASFSACSAIFAMALTASTGNFPEAVSPDSMTAEVPSKTALATSVISARVGELALYHGFEHLGGGYNHFFGLIAFVDKSF